MMNKDPKAHNVMSDNLIKTINNCPSLWSKHVLISFGLLVISLCLAETIYAQSKVILDTDMDSDVDDVQALAVLHALEQAKKVEILGVIVTSDDSSAASCVDVINTYYDRPDIPVGFLKGQSILRNFSKYTKALSAEYPHDLKSVQQTEDATLLYRKLLADSPDSSVTIVTIGHLTNLQNLLQSGPDEISDLDGMALANKKVDKWICMGGQFPEGKEANFYRPDPQSTLYCIEHWKKRVTFCGWEVGNKIITGGNDLKNGLNPKHPVYRAYELYNDFSGRPSWDQVAIILLTEESSTFFTTEKEGYVHVHPDGSNTWKTGQNKNHEYVLIRKGINPASIARFIDDMVIRLGKF